MAKNQVAKPPEKGKERKGGTQMGSRETTKTAGRLATAQNGVKKERADRAAK